MSPHDLEERGRSLEDEFFHKENEKLRQQLREKKTREHSMEELAAASGIRSEIVLGRLVDLGVSVESLAAFSLVPLVHVGWADGTLLAAEREALLRAASENGIPADSPAHALLTSMLDAAPAASLFDAWIEYAGALTARLPAAEAQHLRDDVLARAREVASAAGGFLGLGKVSDAEHQVLERIEAAFGS